MWARLIRLQHQLRIVRTLHRNIIPLELELDRIEKLSDDCEEANIEENDYTVYSYDELEYEYGLAKESVAKKLSFLDNQVCSRSPEGFGYREARKLINETDRSKKHDQLNSNPTRGI